MQAKRILLTGGGGFVGTWLAPLLHAASPDAGHLILTHSSSPKIEGWSVEKCDLLDQASVNSVVRDFRPDLVIHMAAQSSVGASTHGAIDTWDVNFNGSFLLAGACARFVPDAVFFFTSSAEVYGYAARDGAVKEDAPLMPVSSYGRSKAATEQMLPDVLGNGNKLIITRAFNHTGPGQDDRVVIPSFARQIVKK